MPTSSPTIAKTRGKTWANWLVVRRDESGKIVRIEKTPTAREYAKGLAITAAAIT